MNASRELRDITLIYPNLSTNRVIFRTHCLELCAHRFSQDPYVFWKTFCYVCMVWRPQSLPDHLLGDVVSPGAFPEESWTFLNFLNWSSRKWSWSRTHGSQKGDFEAEIVGGNRWTSPENSPPVTYFPPQSLRVVGFLGLPNLQKGLPNRPFHPKNVYQFEKCTNSLLKSFGKSFWRTLAVSIR